MSSHLNLEKVRKETGGNEPSLDQKTSPVTGTKWLVCREGGSLEGVLTQSDPSEKTWL
jgi:hypothetical protein